MRKLLIICGLLATAAWAQQPTLKDAFKGMFRIGAAVNQLNASQGVQGTEVTNLTSAVNSIQNADIGQVVTAMTQNSVLEQTGMAALTQSNQIQQNVLKLLQ